MKKLDSYFELGLSKDEMRLATTATIAGASTLWYFGALFVPPLDTVASGFITLLYQNRGAHILLANAWFVKKAQKIDMASERGGFREFFSRLPGGLGLAASPLIFAVCCRASLAVV